MSQQDREAQSQQPKAIVGPTGELLTIADLPPSDTVRWVVRRKAEVVTAVRHGLLGLEEACERYNISREEFQSWERLIERHGIRGLRTTRLQDYRSQPDHRNDQDHRPEDSMKIEH